MFHHCLSTLPELFDGNPPFNGRGAISFAMNVAEVLRTLELLENININRRTYMKVLMFGWEYPPHVYGGLATANFGISEGLHVQGDIETRFVFLILLVMKIRDLPIL